MMAVFTVHTISNSPPFFEAAGVAVLWQALGAVGVVGLVNFVLTGVVMVALVLGRNSWIGLVAGLGYFCGDFYVGALGSGDILGIKTTYRYTFSYYALSILERLFPSDPFLSLPRSWTQAGIADPLQALILLSLFGLGLAFVSILLFHHQDLGN